MKIKQRERTVIKKFA